MTYLYFNDDISDESIKTLAQEIQQTEGEIRLYLSTEGGYMTPMHFLIDILNNRKSEITLVLTDIIASAGTFLLIYFEGKIEFKDLEILLFHVEDRKNYGLRKQTIDSKKVIRMDKETNRISAERFKEKGWLSEKQKKKFLRGEDVVLYKDEIEKIINKR